MWTRVLRGSGRFEYSILHLLTLSKASPAIRMYRPECHSILPFHTRTPYSKIQIMTMMDITLGNWYLPDCWYLMLGFFFFFFFFLRHTDLNWTNHNFEYGLPHIGKSWVTCSKLTSKCFWVSLKAVAHLVRALGPTLLSSGYSVWGPMYPKGIVLAYEN